MTHLQQLITDFHQQLGLTVGEFAKIRELELRRTLCREESRELDEAFAEGDLAHIIKEACDVLVVVIGTFVAFGIDLLPFFEAVNASNVAKKGGEKRPDGKALKPAGWQPPPIEAMLKQLLEIEKELRRAAVFAAICALHDTMPGAFAVVVSKEDYELIHLGCTTLSSRILTKRGDLHLYQDGVTEPTLLSEDELGRYVTLKQDLLRLLSRK